MKRFIVGLALLVAVVGCTPGARMVRIVETGASGGIMGIGTEASGIRVETSAEPLAACVDITYKGVKLKSKKQKGC